MTDSQEINDIAKETIYVLNNFNSTFISKISKQILKDLIELAKGSNKVVKIDKSKSLNEQNILPETKDMIALLYYNYIATPDEKKKILQIWNENEARYQEKIRRQYNLDNLFKKDNVVNSYNTKKEIYTDMIEYKENIFQKIINKIKEFFTFRKNS